jgi:hypothetical protein
MAAGRSVGFALIGAIAGAVLGGGAGVFVGLAFNSIADTSDFEGFSGYVVALCMVCGVISGFLAGILTGLRMAR